MDPNYVAVAKDINRMLPEHYECINVTPVRRYRTWDEDGNQELGEGYVPANNASIAEYIGVTVIVKDEYREPWWNARGGAPQVTLPCPPELFSEMAGIADAIVPELTASLDAFIDQHRPTSKKSSSTKTTAKAK